MLNSAHPDPFTGCSFIYTIDPMGRRVQMFLIDDIVLAPMKGILWIFKGINDAVEEERANEAGDITAKLSELYILLETGQMTEAQFDAEEKVLLDRLDAIKERVENMEDEESE